MKLWAGVGVVVLVACSSDPPPAAVMVPAPSASPPPSAEPAPVASVAPSAAPVASAEAPPPTTSANLWGSDLGPDPLASAAPAGSSRPQKGHAPSLRQGVVQVTGRLPPEVIQRIVRQNFGRFRLCYENGLRTNSTLGGRVAVKFTIDKSGAVVSPADGGSDLPDKAVVSCVVKGFTNLSFPQPEGGTVAVVYPIVFAP